VNDPVKLYFVVGEVSGDALGADLLEQFAKLKIAVQPMGLGGFKMQSLGLSPLFNSSDIAIMGVSGVVSKLPTLLARVRAVANDILSKEPDVVLLIDSPDFAKLVAKRVKAKRPDLPIIKYVCPTVWSWRPGRAKKMNSYIDHVFAILPFEPQVMKDLQGPPTTYVGHPLVRLAGKTNFEKKKVPANPPTVLLLPGSRKSEISRLLPIIKASLDELINRGSTAKFVLPAVPHMEQYIRQVIADWPNQPEILSGEEAKWKAMQTADAAIAASGTVLLELALYGIPTVSIYKLDPLVNALRFLMTAWTAALPNLIADKVIVPEQINDHARPGVIARLIEDLVIEGPRRQAQLDGFKLVNSKMKQKKAPGAICAQIILDFVKQKKSLV
jgi:lipid-A-disaccharide synthase